jgi:DNA-binding NarL/FixJ family response regulator
VAIPLGGHQRGAYMPTSDSISVLSVDDHPIVRNGIAFALQQQRDMELVGEAKNGLDAILAFRQYRPDVTLMDLRMPQMNGIDATVAIREEFPHARIIALTTYSGDIQASRALRAGVAGYLLKGMLATELVDTIRRVHAGQRRIPPEIALELAEHFSADDLSAREIEVLRGVASGCSNKIVADNLCITEDTVKGHMKSILAKLQANDRTHAVMIAIRRGYLDE